MEPPPPTREEPKFGGYTRFDIECEFVQSLAHPGYLQHLAIRKHLSDPRFVAYLKYLLYWKEPPYLKYLSWPGPCIKHLELLQQERFRREILSPNVVATLAFAEKYAAQAWHGKVHPSLLIYKRQ